MTETEQHELIVETAGETEPASDMQTSDLVAFLQANPNIFQQHPELLELVTLTDSRGTASLIERQVGMLKERLRQQQSQQSEFFQVARENEQISDAFTKIICQLIGFTNLSEFATEFPQSLRSIFEIDEVSFKTQQAASRRPSDNQGYDDAVRRLVNQRAVCDNRWPSAIMGLFFTEHIKSAALIPMRTSNSGESLGILALGSTDPERYTNDLGTAHLDRLGLMSGICLARLQPTI
ncbi:MAG: hypothetical protein ACI9FR_002875 [Cryomorphaceae bacterium]|jgi:uncharacterized protein YigA (DUF484 family)